MLNNNCMILFGERSLSHMLSVSLYELCSSYTYLNSKCCKQLISV